MKYREIIHILVVFIFINVVKSNEMQIIYPTTVINIKNDKENNLFINKNYDINMDNKS